MAWARYLEPCFSIFLKTFTYLHRDDSPAAQNEAKQVLAPWIQSGRAVVTDHLDSIQPFVGAIFLMNSLMPCRLNLGAGMEASGFKKS